MITLIKGKSRKSVILGQLANGLEGKNKVIIDLVGIPPSGFGNVDVYRVYSVEGMELENTLKQAAILPGYHLFLYANVPEDKLDGALNVLRKYEYFFESLYLTVQTQTEDGHFELVEIREA